MGLRDTLREADAAAFSEMESGGIADRGQYTPSGGGPAVEVRTFYLAEEAIQNGEFGAMVVEQHVLTIFRADLDAPQSGATVLVDGVTYTLRRKVYSDPSLVKFVVSVA